MFIFGELPVILYRNDVNQVVIIDSIFGDWKILSRSTFFIG